MIYIIPVIQSGFATLPGVNNGYSVKENLEMQIIIQKKSRHPEEKYPG